MAHVATALACVAVACAEPTAPMSKPPPGAVDAAQAQTADADLVEGVHETAPRMGDGPDASADGISGDGAMADLAPTGDAGLTDSPSDAVDGGGPEVVATDIGGDASALTDAATPATAEVSSSDAVEVAAEISPATDVAVPKYATCTGLLACVQSACSPAWADYCAADCEADASAAALASWSKAAKGIQGCQFKCANKPAACAQACANDMFLFSKILCMAEGQTGGAKCGEVYSCIYDSCATTDDACVTTCARKASSAAIVDLMAMIECSIANGGKGLVVGCTQQMLKCMSGGVSGTGSCLQVAGCADGCMQSGSGGEENCLGACFAKASPAGQQSFTPLFKCLLSAGAAANDCAGPLLACVPGSGTAGCAAVAACIGKCAATNPGSACALECLEKAGPGQGSNWLKFEGCMVANCKSCLGKPCELACRDINCAAPWQACSAP